MAHLAVPSDYWLKYRKSMGSATSQPPQLAVTSIKIERERLDQFKALAAAHRRTVSQQMRWLIDRAIEDEQEKAA